MRRIIAILVLLIAASGCETEGPATACCSCMCVAPDGGVCAGARREARGEETCEERCDTECSERGCLLNDAAVISEGACEGGLLPFVGGTSDDR